jgi:ATP-dependent DNA ligase
VIEHVAIQDINAFIEAGLATVGNSPAIYVVFDMLADSENLLGSPFRVRRATLERFFENSVPRSSPLYLSARTGDLREVEKWVGHIGQQLDGIIAKRADAPYRPGTIIRPSKSKTIGMPIVS